MNNERKEGVSVYSVGSQNQLVPIRSKRTFFKKRSQISNLLVVILYFLVGTLSITVVVLAVLYACSSMVKTCDSEDCVRVAASLKESMNVSVDPCDDFYQYACGRWPQEHPIPDFSLTNSWFSERSHRVALKLRDLLKADVNMSASEMPGPVIQAKTLFTSCMDMHTINELNLSPLFDLLELLNLPMKPAAITNKTTNYIEQLVRVKKILGYDVFFGFEVMVDPMNKNKNIIYFHEPNHSSPFPHYKELEKRLRTIRSRLRKLEDVDDEDISSKKEDAEIAYMTDVIKQVINNGTVNECTSEDELILEMELKEFVAVIYNISHALNMASKDHNQSITIENLSDSDYMLIDDLQNLTDAYVIDINVMNSSSTPEPIWRPFIESFFEGIDKLDLDNKDKILIGNLEYLKNVAILLDILPEEILESYIWWNIVDKVVPHSSAKFISIWNEYVMKLIDVEVGESRSLFCTSVVNQLMGMALSRMFVDPTFHNNKINKVLEMLEDIKEAFGSLVTKTDWMDQSTKTATLNKSQKMSSEIGYPTWLFDDETLNEYYNGVNLSETTYLENMVQIIRLQLNTTWNLHEDNFYNES